MSEDLIKKIEELQGTLQKEVEARKQLAKVVIKIADKLDEHVKGGMTIEELQACLNKINELVSALHSAGIGVGEGGQSLLAQMLMAQRMQQQQAGETEIKTISSSKRKKLKELLEEDEEGEEQGEDEE